MLIPKRPEQAPGSRLTLFPSLDYLLRPLIGDSHTGQIANSTPRENERRG